VINLACSLQVRTELLLPRFYGRTLSRTLPAACTGPPCQEMAQIHAATRSLASAWNSTDFCQITIIPTLLTRVLSLSRKNEDNHYCCPISAIILMTSKLEAILKIYCGSLKTVQRGRGVRGRQVERGREGEVGDHMAPLIRS
jgi:hypothetical protein